MSNGENVIADSWDNDDNLTNQLDKIKKEAAELQEQKKFEDETMPLQNGNIPAIMLAMRPDDGNYATSKPAFKILRRPTQSSDSKNSSDKPKQPIKTLQQREQEYAEARLRILGSAKNPEDELDAALDKLLATKITQISPPLDTSTGNNTVNCTKVNSTLAQQQLLLSSLTYHSPDRSLRQRQPSASAVLNRETNITGFSKNFNQSVTTETDESENNFSVRNLATESVLRMPRGPDNSGGFNIRR
ncbi:SUZ domain-containing protein 1 [Condylostylus longicornis]|uniref:SUZ domain-containing protein 1 n=1 Tax=Condylostylus longicornis TaxID=2530218 RepID=UPI00244DFBBE|nr:SUZ domain-containing protein 1 [Condylostylus longicornis]